MGIATILAARSIVILATGEHKAEAVARALTGPMTPLCQHHCCDRPPSKSPG